MEEFLIPINPQEKVLYESQIVLWYYYKIMYNSNIDFENFIMSEPLILQFNKSIINDKFREQMIQVLDDEEQAIHKLLCIFNTKPWKIVKPVVWENNLDNQYFIENLTLSHRFEIYIDCIFRERNIDMGLYYGRDGQHNGETRIGIEIKRDMKLAKTGNIYLEYAEKHYENNQNWVSSGILKNDNTRYFLIGDIQEYYILSKEDLVKIYESLRKRTLVEGCRLVGAERGTSLGFIMSRDIAAQLNISIDNLIRNL